LHLLALDLGTRTGWCRRDDFGTVHFNGDVGQKASELELWLTENIDAYRTLKGDPLTDIAIEAPIVVHGATNLSATIWLLGAHVIVRKVAHEHQLQLHVVNVSQWRRYFIGQPRAPRSVPQKDRRKWLKAAVMDECKKRGLAVMDDNMADAVAIGLYVRSQIEGGMTMGDAA
jgi:hypothetical protein